MNTKKFRLTLANLTIAVIGSLPVCPAQVARTSEPSRIHQTVYLWALYHYNYKDLVITNNSNAAIPQGTTINWSILGQYGVGLSGVVPYLIKGSFTLERMLPVGGQVTRHSVAGPENWACPCKEQKAWFIPGSAAIVPRKPQISPDKKPPLQDQKSPPPPAAAGRPVPGKSEPNKPLQKLVDLEGDYNRGTFEVKVKNNTPYTIPKGTVIYWSIKPASASMATGSFTLQSELRPWGDHVRHRAPGVGPGGPYTTKAWYLK